MASEYIQYLIKDEKPTEAPPPLSPKERRKNWLYYHKWHLIIGAVALIIAADLIKNALHIGEILPDVQMAYVGRYVLPADALTVIEEQLSASCPDGNGDGRSVVRFNSYAQPEGAEGDESTLTLRTASTIQQMADLEARQSFLFLMDDPKGWDEQVRILAHPDGTLPETETDSSLHIEDYVIPWNDCPVLAALTAEDGPLARLDSCDDTVLSYLESLYVGRRGYWTDKTSDNYEACVTFWDNLRS